jgi:hypothetical protein
MILPKVRDPRFVTIRRGGTGTPGPTTCRSSSWSLVPVTG